MLKPIPVELAPHSPDWAKRATREAARLRGTLGDALVAVHHIGSTAIPAIAAKPIVDLLAEVTDLASLDRAEEGLKAMGYEWWGEYGIAGRRYCTLTDPTTGKRAAQLHCFATGSPHPARHLAFRDYMRANLDRARAYETEKIRARDIHPGDSHAYTEGKSAWIKAEEAAALAWAGNRRADVP